MRYILLMLILAAPRILLSQSITQTLRGSIVDKQVRQPLVGATVVVLNTNPLLGASSDENGNFRIANVPVGTYTIQVSYVGYEPIVLPNISIASGKKK
jgi:hypothetical protein